MGDEGPSARPAKEAAQSEPKLVIPVFSPALEKALQEVLHSDDPLDSADFDPIEYINETFPDEASLSNGKLDGYLGQVRRRVGVLQENISKHVRDHSCQRLKTRQAVESATGSMQDLFDKIKAIKSKAEESEVMVQEICRDIKSLDHAKRHLTDTIDKLRNLHMLVSAVQQLDRMSDAKEYRDAASLFWAISDLMEEKFGPYQDVPKLKALKSKVDAKKYEVKEQILREFRGVVPGGTGGNQERIHRLQGACEVVDVLGANVKKELLDWFSDTQLQPYVAVFAFGEEGGTLDQTERRYAWLRRHLRTFEEEFAAVFPTHWDVPAILSQEFCRLTRAHLVEIMDSRVVDTQTLIKALQKTIDFERELTMRFRHAGVGDVGELTAGDESGEAAVNLIKLKYEMAANKKKKKDEQQNGERAGPPGSAAAAKGHKRQKFVFNECISDCFAPHMGGYVALERSNISDLITKVDGEQVWRPEEEQKPKSRYSGSDELFLYIKKSIKRCGKLAKNQTLFELFQEYQSGLEAYANLLESKLPKKEGTLTPSDLQALCMTVNTAEYCHDTVGQLEESVRKIIDEQYQDRVTLESTKEAFHVLCAKTLQVIVDGIFAGMGKALTTMAKMPWSTWEVVGDQSPYVNQINQVLLANVPSAARLISSAYHSFFCTSMVSTLIPKYVDNIFKCRRIGELGAQQLALDAHALKSIMLNIPSIGFEDEGGDGGGSGAGGDGGGDGGGGDGAGGRRRRKKRGPPRAFTRYVNREMGKAEAILKTLVSPSSHLIPTFKKLLPKSKNEDLIKIMSLRGLRKSEQQALLNDYNKTVPSENRVDPSLVSENNLKKLFNKFDMSNLGRSSA